MSMQDGIKAVQQAFHNAASSIRWPMYVRQARQFLRHGIEGFDERKYGFASVVDLLRAAGKEGVFRIERDRQGAVRVFPGANLAPRAAPMDGLPVDIDEAADVEVPAESWPTAAVALDQPTVEGTVDPVALPEPPMSAADMDELSMDGDGRGRRRRPAARQRAAPAARPRAQDQGRRPASRSRAPRTPRGGAAKTARPRSRKTSKS